MEGEYKTSPERRVLGELGNSDPVSPTANLRLLTTLASSLKNAETPSTSISPQTPDVTPGESVTPGCLKFVSRKEKSLSLLCNKFLNLFPLTMQEASLPKEISLNLTAKELGTEKRRIYDIINVLESLEMASKAGKNQYYWHGQSRLTQTLAKLKTRATELGLDHKIQEIQKINRAYIDDSCPTCTSHTSLMVPQSPVVNYCLSDGGAKDEKSLSVMCRKFVMLFLVSMENGVINLDIAAKVLINESPDSEPDLKSSAAQSRYKTKVRRLYDVANVLSAIGLIEKVDLYNCIIRKPIFKYTGPKVDTALEPEETPVVESQSIVGMTTPSKKKCFGFRALSRISRLCAGGSTTPMSNHREPKKRKLFDNESDHIKFERTISSPCLGQSTTPSTSERLDESILQVAEMELRKITSTNEFLPKKPRVCTKLFPRHNSDPRYLQSSPKKVIHHLLESPSKNQIDPRILSPKKSANVIDPRILSPKKTNGQHSVGPLTFSPKRTSTITSPVVGFPAVSKENLVTTTHDTVSPVRTVRINVPLDLKISKKFIKLNNSDLKKLVPVTTETTSDSDVRLFTHIPVRQISSGDTFRAIKVGNTVQLVPIEPRNDEKLD